MTAKDYRSQARMALFDRWLLAAGVTFIAALLGGISLGDGGSNRSDQTYYVPEEVYVQVVFILLGVLAVFAVYSIFVGNIIGMGYHRFTLNLFDDQSPRLSNLFGEFRKGNYRRSLLLVLFMSLIIIAGTLLLIIPGILASLAYVLAPYLQLEYPELSPSQCLKASRKLMHGHKWDLFSLNFSFVGWAILSAFTFGIGNLFLTPYQSCAHVAFYRERMKGVNIYDYI